jgi:septum formation protein
MYQLQENQTLVLASASPRRREMLSRIGLDFTLAPAEIDETLLPDEDAQDAVCRLAESKAKAAMALHPKSVILAADTLVVLGKRILGKPQSPSEARDMLRGLSGREHLVVTGFCLRAPKWTETGCARSLIKFRDLSAAEIAAYVHSGEPMDKAGAYAVQGQGAALVERVKGSYTNVVGLPLACIVDILISYNVIRPKRD